MSVFTIREYWEAVRKIEAELPEFPWVVSIEDPLRGLIGVQTTQVTRNMAARAVHEKRARLATTAEISAHLAEMEDRKSKAHCAEREKRGIGVYVLPPATPVKGTTKR
jgi:hypothetical protein